MFRKINITLSIVIVVLGLSAVMSAQTKRGATRSNVSMLALIEAARGGQKAADPEIVRMVNEAYADTADEDTLGGNDIVGTWNIHIPQSTGGNAPFDALHTFGADGIFVETSSLLATGTEGPAHGAYERARRGYNLTFEVFIFDPATGENVGRVRVRNFIRMLGPNNFTAYSAVDFIELDGTVIENIDSGIFTGQKMTVRGI